MNYHQINFLKVLSEKDNATKKHIVKLVVSEQLLATKAL